MFRSRLTPQYLLSCLVGLSASFLFGYFLGPRPHLIEHWMGINISIFCGVFLVGLPLGWHWMAPRTEGPALLRTIRATVGMGACWGFGDIAAHVSAGTPVIDLLTAHWFHEHANPALSIAAIAITSLGAPWFMTSATSIGAAALVWRRQWDWLLALGLTVPGGALLNMLLKNAFHRERPQFEHPILTLDDYSFPSGHTMMALLLYGLIAAFLLRMDATRWRTTALLLLILLVPTIGMTRIYLGVHYLSDVIGALAVGSAWLILSLTTVETLVDRRHTRVIQDPSQKYVFS